MSTAHSCKSPPSTVALLLAPNMERPPLLSMVRAYVCVGVCVCRGGGGGGGGGGGRMGGGELMAHYEKYTVRS